MEFTITQISLHEIALPLVEPFRTAHGDTFVRRLLLTELVDADGVRVLGECSALETPDYLPETIDSAWTAIRDHLAPAILGKTFASPAEVSAALEVTIPSHNMAKAAIEMPTWALAAVKEGVSLSEFIGGTRKMVETGLAIGLQDSPSVLAAKVEGAFAQGYARIKMKIKPGADLEYIEAACMAADGGAHIQVDANCSYTLEDVEQLREMDAFGLMLLEQPLAWENLEAHAALQREIETPISLDESLDGLESVRNMIRLQAGKIVCLKPGRVGGFTTALQIHDLCREKGIPLWCGGMLESGIGRAYNVALASKPGFTLPGDLSPSRRYWAEDIVSPEWVMNEGGEVGVPVELPGLGVEVDRDRIRELTLRSEVV
ncbi:MAG: o-succinylbenzoate synthase [Candidatus Hydrogenedentota bacterium]